MPLKRYDRAGVGAAGGATHAQGEHDHYSTGAPADWRELVTRELRRLPSTTAGREGEWKIRCLQPDHEDRNPSATWSEARGCGTCHSCGATWSTKDAADLLGIDLPTNGGPDRPPGVWAHVTEDGHRYDLSQWWSYRDRDGAELGFVARYDCPGQSKTFRPFFQRKGGEWAAGYEDKNCRPLYGLAELAGRPDAPVIVAEGEKAADAAAGLLPAYVAVSWPGGSSAVRRADWSQIAGRAAVVWPDHDDAGRKALPYLLDALETAGCDGVRVVDVDALELEETGDAADLVELPGGELPILEGDVGSLPTVGSEETDQEQPAVRGRLLADLLEDPSLLEPVEPLAPKVAWPEHVTLLAGREKRGKSTLSAAAVAAVTHGSPFLDGVARRGVAFWVGVDREHVAGVIRRAVTFGCNPRSTVIETTFGADPVSELEQAVEHWEPDLIVIDKLSGLAQNAVEKFNQPEQWMRLLERIIAIARAGPAVVLVAEAGKQTGEYAYSNVIGGQVDAILTLRRDTADPQTVRKVEALGRDLEGLDDFAWRLSPDGNSVEIVGGTGQSLELRIVQFVLTHPRCSKSAVHDHVGGNRRAVLSTIDKLLATASLIDQGDGSRSELVVPYD